MSRTKGILAAATFTGLVLITILALGFGDIQAKPNEDAVVTPLKAEVNSPQTVDMTNSEALQEWQSYSAELEQAVRIMQERETAYQQQLDAANQTILQLQDRINSADSVSAYDDDDRHEHEENEHEEHEREFEFGEDFD